MLTAPSSSLPLLSALASTALALNDGFQRTPVLGFNTYNDVACSPNATYVESTINALVSKGLLAAGYNHFQIDCGWQGFQRPANGSITYDSSVFPNGIAPLSSYATGKGFIWSMYTDEGIYSCDTSDNHRLGSLGYEKQDAAQFAQWNTSYVKVDNCYVTANNDAPKNPSSDFVTRYTTMSNALQGAGIKGMLVCQWGVPYENSTAGLQGPAQWTPPLSTSFRVSDDIAEGWINVMRIMNEAINVNLRGLSGPDHVADMDLLEVGNAGMTTAEQMSHFAVWSMFKSALMISTDVPSMSAQTLSTLTNAGLLAINQDSLGTPVSLVQRYSENYDLFSGPLANGDEAVLLLDQSNTSRTLSVTFTQLGIESATVTNLWTGAVETAATSYSAPVSPHGSLPLRLSAIKHASTVAPKLTYYQATSAALAGGANIQSCGGCSNGQKVGDLGSGASATLSGIRTSQASQNVRFDYINCDISYLNSGLENVRGASISVNGGPAQPVLFPLSGYNWTEDIFPSFLVQLSGFNTAGENNLTISSLQSVTPYAPDFDRIAVVT